MADFPRLMEPGWIGGVSVHNRLVMAPMTTGYPHPNGSVSERTKAYYQARAAGGVGLIIVEACLVHPTGKTFDHQISIYEDGFIPGLRQLTEAVHAQGARTFLQLHHGGMLARSDLTGQVAVAPSALSLPGRTPPRPLTREEIAELVEAFGQAARRAREAGFDGVELHGAHGYLINQFLSPVANQRKDEYGNTPEGRLRFALECVRRSKELAGRDYPIVIRLSVDEFHPQGLNLPQSQPIAQALQSAGADAIHVSAGAAWSEPTRDPRIPIVSGTAEGVFLHLAQGIKEAVRVPVIAVGHIFSAETGEAALTAGQADFIAMGRGLLAEPALVSKLAAGRRDESIPCIGCDACQTRSGHPGIFCAVNPETGREFQLRLEPTLTPQDVLVLGGSLPGIELARVAALRGHRVSVWCSENGLGGLTAQRAEAPGQGVLAKVVKWYAGQMARLRVTVKTTWALDLAAVEAAGAPVVVVASARQNRPAFAAGSSEALSALDAISGTRTTRGQVVAAGSGVLLAEAALSLALRGSPVVLVEKSGRVASDANPRLAARLRLALAETGAEIAVDTWVVEASGGRAILESQHGRREVGYDTLVYSDGIGLADDLVEQLRQRGLQAYSVGDAYESYELGRLMGSAAELARQL